MDEVEVMCCFSHVCLCLLLLHVFKYFNSLKSASVSSFCVVYGQICDRRSHVGLCFYKYLLFPRHWLLSMCHACGRYGCYVYITFIQFRFLMYMMLCESLIFMIPSKLIHKKVKGQRQKKFLDEGM